MSRDQSCITIGSAGVKDTKVKITNLADPEKGQVNMTVTGTNVTQVQYGKAGDKKGDYDKDFAEMTDKNAKPKP